MDRRCFLKILSAPSDQAGWQVHAYCLTANHFHLVVETPRPNLVTGMKWLLQTCTSRFNRHHHYFGHLMEWKSGTPFRKRLALGGYG